MGRPLQFFRITASSYTLRPHLGLKPGSELMCENFEFPKKDFVWQNEKIDSRPYKLGPVLHKNFELGEISSRLDDVSSVRPMGALELLNFEV